MRIKQARVSKSLEGFKKDFLTKYDLTNYVNKKEPCVFFGCYRNDDIQALKDHEGEKTLIWGGSDTKNICMVDKLNIRHIAISSFISDDLKKANINHEIIPLAASNCDDFKPYRKGSDIYIYLGGEHKRDKYGYRYLAEIRKALPDIKIHEVYYGQYPRKELIEIYRKCFIGLRLTDHDGCSNTVIELGLMGRKVIHNGDQPNCLHYANVGEIINHIKAERKNKSYGKLNSLMLGYLKKSDDIFNKKCKVSVIITAHKQSPYIIHAIKSAKDQEFDDYEIILAGDGVDLSEYADGINYVQAPKCNFSNTFNTAARYASGKYLKVLAYDDKLKPKCLQYLYNRAVETGADIVHGGALNCMDFDCHEYYPAKEIPDIKSLLKVNYIHGGSILIKKDTFI